MALAYKSWQNIFKQMKNMQELRMFPLINQCSIRVDRVLSNKSTQYKHSKNFLKPIYDTVVLVEFLQINRKHIKVGRVSLN